MMRMIYYMIRMIYHMIRMTYTDTDLIRVQHSQVSW